MSSRDAILSRIRSLLASEPAQAIPPVPEVWPRTNPSTAAMAQRFVQELQAVHGEAYSVGSMEEARAKFSEVVGQVEADQVAAMNRPLCRELVAHVPEGQVLWVPDNPAPKELAQVPLGLVEADCLLADTGSAMIACATPGDRLLCYLPPACVVVASADRLHEHLPAAWERIAPRVADPHTRGEFVFVTGPSRTADIEKILILGVHGPKRLVVLIVG